MLVARACSAPIRSSIIRSTPACGEAIHSYWPGSTTTLREKSALMSMGRSPHFPARPFSSAA
jgi:hypothetical protein